MTCWGRNSMYALGQTQCGLFFDCLDNMYEAIWTYTNDVEKCSTINSQNNSEVSYGFTDSMNRLEYVVTKSVKPDVPNHIIKECSEKLPRLVLRWVNHPGFLPPHFRGRYLCQREVTYIPKSIRLFKSCHNFVASCSEAIKCIERKAPCFSFVFGMENVLGFFLNHSVSYNDGQFLLNSCTHWGVELRFSENYDLYCSAKSVFKLNSFPTFCQSYEWICQRVLHCLKTRQECSYTPYKGHKSILEIGTEGIYDYQMPMFGVQENPRDWVNTLYECNRKFGYDNHLYLYFVTTFSESPLNFDYFRTNDTRKFQLSRSDIVFTLSSSSAAYTTMHEAIDGSNLYTIWACKRTVLSEVNCEMFLDGCEQVKNCLAQYKLQDESPEFATNLPKNDLCHSPLPVSTVNPLPAEDAGGRGYHPGILGPSVNYVLPLSESYPRVFDRLSYSGYETSKVRSELEERRSNLFFDLFLDDCRHKHEFEGFLIEPFFAETVNYLICSIPLGIVGK